MIICGFGKTRFFGSPINSIENTLNILDGLRNRITRVRGESVANETLVACVKLIVCEKTDKEKEAMEEFLSILKKIANGGTEVELVNREGE